MNHLEEEILNRYKGCKDILLEELRHTNNRLIHMDRALILLTLSILAILVQLIGSTMKNSIDIDYVFIAFWVSIFTIGIYGILKSKKIEKYKQTITRKLLEIPECKDS